MILLLMKSTYKRFFLLLIIFIIFFLGVATFRVWRSDDGLHTFLTTFLKHKATNSKSYTPINKSALRLEDVELISRINQEYALLTKAVVPSVVSIDTTEVRTETLMNFFGESDVRRYAEQGKGSGVIVSKEGHIITNYHVVAGQKKIRITVHGGKNYEATMIGEDRLLDIAVIKIKSNDSFIPLKIGDSSQVEVGQLVFAVGNSFGLGETVTQGIISAKERSLSDNQRDLFQTDAAINPGNSGGPLVNIKGELIGINVAIYSRDLKNPGFQGVGFSIPSNEVNGALKEIIEQGRPIRGYLGVQMRDLDSAIRFELNYTKNGGCAVLDTTHGAPADLAGLKSRDVVVAYDNELVRDTQHLITLVQRSKIGKRVKISVWRENQLIILEATITEATSPPVYSEIPMDQEIKDNLEILRNVGIQVRDLTDEERTFNNTGVLITRVFANGRAAGKLQPSDLIVALNDKNISSSKEFYQNLVSHTSVQTINFIVVRSGLPIPISLPAP